MRQKEEQEQPKGAALWLILTLVTGIAGLYVVYFLTVDYFHHEQRQIDVANKANAVLRRLGAARNMQYNQRLPQRHFWLNLLVTIFTLGIWSVIWQYRYFADGNRHFENQWPWEDELSSALS